MARRRRKAGPRACLRCWMSRDMSSSRPNMRSDSPTMMTSSPCCGMAAPPGPSRAVWCPVQTYAPLAPLPQAVHALSISGVVTITMPGVCDWLLSPVPGLSFPPLCSARRLRHPAYDVRRLQLKSRRQCADPRGGALWRAAACPVNHSNGLSCTDCQISIPVSSPLPDAARSGRPRRRHRAG